MIVEPLCSSPRASASRIMPSAARSLMLPPGLRNSSLANTPADGGGESRVSWSIGVEPTSWVMSEAIRRREELTFAADMEIQFIPRDEGYVMRLKFLEEQPQILRLTTPKRRNV